jgi:Fe-S-cluster containining protein
MAGPDASPLPAGDFTTWLGMIGSAISSGATSDVPCGTCSGCCTAAQFIHIGADEADCLAHIPAALLFPAPGMPDGTVVLGYDERGRCPMLVDGACSIYHHRPRTCRAYDCRVFAATGIESDKPTIAATARRWHFDYADTSARDRQQEIREIAARADLRASPTQRAVMALQG